MHCAQRHEYAVNGHVSPKQSVLPVQLFFVFFVFLGGPANISSKTWDSRHV